jgi:hypothetical protein
MLLFNHLVGVLLKKNLVFFYLYVLYLGTTKSLLSREDN